VHFKPQHQKKLEGQDAETSLPTPPLSSPGVHRPADATIFNPGFEDFDCISGDISFD
jgi:hypothetical protein